MLHYKLLTLRMTEQQVYGTQATSSGQSNFISKPGAH